MIIGQLSVLGQFSHDYLLPISVFKLMTRRVLTHTRNYQFSPVLQPGDGNLAGNSESQVIHLKQKDPI